jgi:hypothetical protein
VAAEGTAPPRCQQTPEQVRSSEVSFRRAEFRREYLDGDGEMRYEALPYRPEES